jgi:hypothetical protein
MLHPPHPPGVVLPSGSRNIWWLALSANRTILSSMEGQYLRRGGIKQKQAHHVRVKLEKGPGGGHYVNAEEGRTGGRAGPKCRAAPAHTEQPQLQSLARPLDRAGAHRAPSSRRPRGFHQSDPRHPRCAWWPSSPECHSFTQKQGQASTTNPTQHSSRQDPPEPLITNPCRPQKPHAIKTPAHLGPLESTQPP